jgi:hypothetical protein
MSKDPVRMRKWKAGEEEEEEEEEGGDRQEEEDGDEQEEEEEEQYIYRLYAVVVHLDVMNSSQFGHYVAFARAHDEELGEGGRQEDGGGSDGSWYCFDDAKVKPCSLWEVQKQKAYILFYSREPRGQMGPYSPPTELPPAVVEKLRAMGVKVPLSSRPLKPKKKKEVNTSHLSCSARTSCAPLARSPLARTAIY